MRQLRARDLLRGDLEGADLEQYVEERVLTTTLDKALNWARSNALWPATFGLACCAIEMMSIVTSRYDSARFGAEVFRASPAPGRHADPVRPGLDQDGAGHPPHLRPDARAEVGDRDGRLRVQRRRVQQLRARGRRDKFLPVDVHVPGCPPRPEALIHGILKLQRKVQGHPDLGLARRATRREGTEELPHPNVAPRPRRAGERA